MPRARDRRLARLTARYTRAETAAETAAEIHRQTVEARVAIGAALRHSLVQLGVDPASVRMLRVCDEADAEAERAAPPVPGADREPGGAGEKPEASGFWDKIERLAERYRSEPSIDFAQASLAQTLAWCVARQADCCSVLERVEAEADATGDFAADSLQKQRQDKVPRHRATRAAASMVARIPG